MIYDLLILADGACRQLAACTAGRLAPSFLLEQSDKIVQASVSNDSCQPSNQAVTP